MFFDNYHFDLDRSLFSDLAYTWRSQSPTVDIVSLKTNDGWLYINRSLIHSVYFSPERSYVTLTDLTTEINIKVKTEKKARKIRRKLGITEPKNA